MATRFQTIKNMNFNEMEQFLCDLWLLSSDPDTATGCDHCPMFNHCGKGHCGWSDFLNDEWDDRYTTGASNEQFEEDGHYGK